MDIKRLQQRISELEANLTKFRKILNEEEYNYQRILKLTTDIELKSSLMEQHFIHTERQKESIDKTERMYNEALTQLSHLENSDL